MSWINKVGEKYLAKIGVKVEDYCNDFTSFSQPWDQLALLIFARTYHRHIGVYTRNGVWSTRHDNSMKDCIMYLVFNGGSDFSDTVQTGSNEFESVALDLSVKAARRLSPLSWYNPSSSSSEYDSENSIGKSPSLDDPDENLDKSPLLQNSVSSLNQESPLLHDPDENLDESPLLQNSVSSLNQESPLLDNNNQESTLFDVSDKNAGESTLFQDTNVNMNVKTEPSDLQVQQETTPVKRPSSVIVKRPVKRKLNTVTVWASKRVKLTSMPTLAKKLKDYNKLQKNLEKKRRKWKKTKLLLERKRIRDENKKTENKKTDDGKYPLKNFSIKLHKVDIDLELNKLKNRKVKPVNLEEPDPLLNSASQDEVDSILAEDNKKTNGSSKVSEVNLKTSDGSMTVKKYGIRIREKKPRDFLCPALNCEKVCHLIKELNGHIANTHPDSKYRCSMCPKTYSTYNARYKHEHTHYQLPYSCHFCRKRFLFPGLRDRHEGQHTGKNLFPCTWRSSSVQRMHYVSMWKHTQRFVTHALTKTVNKRLTLFKFLNNMKREATVMAIFLCVGQVLTGVMAGTNTKMSVLTVHNVKKKSYICQRM